MIRSLVQMLVLTLVLAGCSSQNQIPPVLTRRPLVEPLPLTIGVYFTPEFRSYRSKCDRWLCPEYDVGTPSVALFELLLAGFFKDIVVLDAMPPAQSNRKIDGILVPIISHFLVDPDRQVIEVTYRMTLYSTSGKDYGTWDVQGSTWGFAADRVRLAMRDAAANFVKGFRQESVVKTWLKQIGIESPVTAPREQLPRTDVRG